MNVRFVGKRKLTKIMAVIYIKENVDVRRINLKNKEWEIMGMSKGNMLDIMDELINSLCDEGYDKLQERMEELKEDFLKEVIKEDKGET